jgi:REP element-mobilizing transposase RayT
LTGLVKKIDTFVKDNKKVDAAAFVVLMQKDSDEAKAKLKSLAKENKIEIPLTIAADDKIHSKLKLDPKVKNSVLIWKNTKVAESFALNEITDKDVEKILAAAKESASSS